MGLRRLSRRRRRDPGEEMFGKPPMTFRSVQPMNKTYSAIFAVSLIMLSCSLVNAGKTAPSYSVSEGRISIADNGLSFALPDNWDPKPSHEQSIGSLKLISFTRNDPVLIVDTHAYYPTITIF